MLLHRSEHGHINGVWVVKVKSTGECELEVLGSVSLVEAILEEVDQGKYICARSVIVANLLVRG